MPRRSDYRDSLPAASASGYASAPASCLGKQRSDGKLAPWMTNPALLPKVPPPMPGGAR
jgi:hypothetical protein